MAAVQTLSVTDPPVEFPLEQPADRAPSSVRHIVCPGCEARFLADDEAFSGVEGCRVRCASCGHRWQYSPDPRGVQPAFLEEAAKAKGAAAPAPPAAPVIAPPPEPDRLEPDRLEPTLAAVPPAGPSALPRPSVAAEPQPASRRNTTRNRALGLAVLAAALVLAAILGRYAVQALFPSTAPIYATLGLGNNTPDVPGAGLKVTVTPIRNADSLVINGDIVNGATISRQVPRLRLTLLDRNKTDLDSKVINPPVAQLQPGAKAHFNTTFEHPTNSAVRVDVTFATD